MLKMYNDTKQDAIKNVEKSDKTRSNYYKTISGLEWGKINNYDLCIDSSIGKEECARVICEYINNRKQQNIANDQKIKYKHFSKKEEEKLF